MEFLRATNPFGKADNPNVLPPGETQEEKRQRIKAQIRGARG